MEARRKRTGVLGGLSLTGEGTTADVRRQRKTPAREHGWGLPLCEAAGGGGGSAQSAASRWAGAIRDSPRIGTVRAATTRAVAASVASSAAPATGNR
ncbi:hypothetical protein RKD20_002299 [Streptomyces sp. SLBN-8D4]